MCTQSAESHSSGWPWVREFTSTQDSSTHDTCPAETMRTLPHEGLATGVRRSFAHELQTQKSKAVAKDRS